MILFLTILFGYLSYQVIMHFLVLFFSVMGGIKIFGLIGFVLGPMVMAMFVSVIEIFRTMEEGSNA